MTKPSETAIAFMWMGILAAYTHQGIMVPRWTRKHIAVAQEIADQGTTTKGPIAICEMVEGAKRFEAEVMRRIERRKWGRLHKGEMP